MDNIVQGSVFGRLTLKSIGPPRGAGKPRVGLWVCLCGCEKQIAITRVKNGNTQSCGCLAIETSRERMTIHGMKGSPEYRSWSAMISRCHSETDKDFYRYGAVGITVCSEWRSSFQAFFDHIGPRPPGKTVDRIIPELGYQPGNVRWATPLEQSRNRRDLTIVRTPAGRMALVDYAAMIGISKGAAHLRLKRGKLEGVEHV
jgi:hypothetical protein